MCVFCEIVKGNIPSCKVYEDDKYLAILDISQTTKGHTLVIPKKHSANIAEMSEEDAKELMGVAHKITKKIVNNLHASGFNLLVNTNEVAGQTVLHTHMHIIPRYGLEDTIKVEFGENKFDLSSVLNEING